jgi:hypothetical protein
MELVPRRFRGNNSAAMRPSMRRTRLDLLALAGLALAALFAAAALPGAASRSWARLRSAAGRRGETDFAARARVLGADYTVAIEAIRQALAPGEPYALVAQAPGEVFSAYWVRYDLAPRPAVLYAGWRRERAKLRQLKQERLRWVVVSYGTEDTPDLYARPDFLRENLNPDGR